MKGEEEEVQSLDGFFQRIWLRTEGDKYVGSQLEGMLGPSKGFSRVGEI